jgi:hypothetical protein
MSLKEESDDWERGEWAECLHDVREEEKEHGVDDLIADQTATDF